MLPARFEFCGARVGAPLVGARRRRSKGRPQGPPLRSRHRLFFTLFALAVALVPFSGRFAQSRIEGSVRMRFHCCRIVFQCGRRRRLEPAASPNTKRALRSGNCYSGNIRFGPKRRGVHAHHQSPKISQYRHGCRARWPRSAFSPGAAMRPSSPGGTPITMWRSTDECPAARGGRSHPRAVGRPRRHPGLPQQPARRRYRHAVAIAHRRDPAVQPVGPHPADLRAALPPSTASASRSRTTTRCGAPWTARSALSSAPRSASPGSMPSPRCGTTATARSPAARIRSPRPTTSRASRSACR